MSDTREQLSPASVGLHWVIGVVMIGMLAFGLVLEDMHPADAAGKAAKSFYMGIHKSIGVSILVFAIWRFARRIRLGLPEQVGVHKTWEKRLSHAVMAFLLFGTLAMPLSGILMSIAGARAVNVFGIPVIPQLLAEKNVALSSFAGGVHGLAGKLLILAIALHIAGALKHHIVDKDGTLRRMMGARVDANRHA
jgi:cytochrome b561